MTTPAAADPAKVPINALHASTIKAMSAFVQQPSIEVAHTVVSLLNALSRHPERFVAPCGYDVYAQTSKMWLDLARHMRHLCEAQCERQLH